MANFEPVGVIAEVRNFNKFIAQIGTMNKGIKSVGISAVGATKGLNPFNVALGAITIGAAGAVVALGAITKALFEIGQESLETAISVESSFAGVLKTTQDLGTNLFDLTDKGEAVFKQFRDLSKEVPLLFEDLADIGQLGGQLNVASEDIADFTKTIASIAVSTNLTEEEAALGLARLATIFGFATDEISDNVEQQASALVFLGNNYAATEQEILLASRNIAGAAAIVGLSQADILGIGTALKVAGVTAEAGGTAVQNALIEIDAAVSQGGRGLFDFAEAAGMTAEEFATLWEEDAQEGFLQFIRGLEASGKDAAIILDDLGLGSARSLRTFLGLANSADTLESAIRDANTAFAENTALQREADIRFSTLDSQLTMLKNSFRDVALEIGLQLAPALQDILDINFNPLLAAAEQEIGPAFETIRKAIVDDLLPAIGNLIDVDFSELEMPTFTEFSEAISSFAESIANNITSISEFVDEMAELKDIFDDKGFITGLIAMGEFTIGLKPEEIENITSAFETFDETVVQPITKFGEELAITDEEVINLFESISKATGFGKEFGDIFIFLPFPLFAIARAIGDITTALEPFFEIMEENADDLPQMWRDVVLEIDFIMQDFYYVMIPLWAAIEAARIKALEIWDTFKTKLLERVELTRWAFLRAWNILKDKTIEVWNRTWGRIIEFAKEIPGKLKTIGADIVQGLIDGINSKIADLVAVMNTLASLITGTTEEDLDSKSPSRVFMRIGEDVVAGLAKGIMGNIDLASGASTMMANRTIGATERVLPTGAISNTNTSSKNVTVNANYYKTQSPQQIIDDLALVTALGV